MSFAQGRNAVMTVRLEPAAPRSRVKHSTTEALRSLGLQLGRSVVLNIFSMTVRQAYLKRCLFSDKAKAVEIRALYISNKYLQ